MTSPPQDNVLEFIDPVELPDSISQRARAMRDRVAKPVTAEAEDDRSIALVLQELETVLENIQYGVMFMGPDLRARMINTAFREMWSVEDGFAVGNPDFFEMIEYLRETGIYEVPDEEWPDYVQARYEAVRAADGIGRESRRADGKVLLYKCIPLPDGGRMLTYFDITQQKQVEAELEESKKVLEARVHELELLKHRLRTQRDTAVRTADIIAENHELLTEVIQNVHEAILVWDDDGKLITHNQRIRHIYPDLADIFRPGLAFDDMIREGYRRGVFPGPENGDEGDLVVEWTAKHDAGLTIDERELGDGRWIRVNRRKTSRGKRVVTITDITMEKENEARITEMASLDPLTGLANRRAFATHLADMAERCIDTAESIGLLLIDLDKFKLINDAYGHPAGDALLKAFADRLTGCLRKSDLAARIGGDEFAAIISDVKDPAALALLADRIVAAMAEPVSFEGIELEGGASIGGALCPGDSDDPENLIALADQALYAAKEAGRGTTRLFGAL